METPIADFVAAYAASDPVRAHMPGHKGKGPLGCEALDITEIAGADSLYEADGIIARSEANAAQLFGSGATLYSTEGSSQCIRAMLYLALLNAPRDGSRPVILAARNCHKTLLYAAAMLDFEIQWLWPEDERYSLCRCTVSASQLRKKLSLLSRPPAAVLVTSPDYLGDVLDIRALAETAHSFGVPLLVDDAHGAYRKFLYTGEHPMDLGADICCDSAHKTLPVLTGGAYLHIGRNAPESFLENARRAMAMFGSTSPSYLILQSLDLANRSLSGDFPARLAETAKHVQALRETLTEKGWMVESTEPMKLTVDIPGRAASEAILQRLECAGIAWEYADPDYLVMMFSPENSSRDFERIARAFPENTGYGDSSRPEFRFSQPETPLTPRQAAFAPAEWVDIENARGRILAEPSVGCPPAVPIAVTGEKITAEMIPVFAYYGIPRIRVVK